MTDLKDSHTNAPQLEGFPAAPFCIFHTRVFTMQNHLHEDVQSWGGLQLVPLLSICFGHRHVWCQDVSRQWEREVRG